MAQRDTATTGCLRDIIADDLASAEADFRATESDEGHDMAVREHGVRLATLRLINCAIRDRDARARSSGDRDTCPEEAVRDVLATMARQREVSAEEFEHDGRIDDAMREREELEIIDAYRPKPLANDALKAAVKNVVEDLEAGSLKDLGRCMSTLKARYPGLIDSKQAGKAVREALS